MAQTAIMERLPYLMTSEELRRFANDRGVEVTTTAAGATTQVMSRYELATLPMTGGFLSFAPGIRNLIYQELLCFEEEGESFCFPEILATSKQVYNEAYGILYGKNQFSVKLSNHGIIVQGRRYGDYKESRFGSVTAASRTRKERSIQDIQWPEFLRRVHSLKFSITDEHWHHFVDVRKVSTENVLYSLCMFLHDDSKLRTFHLDLRRFDRHKKVVARTADLHCLLLLDPLPTLKIEGDCLVDEIAVDSKVDMRTIGRSSMARCRTFDSAIHRAMLSSVREHASARDEQLLQSFVDVIGRALARYIRPTIIKSKLGKEEAKERFSDFMNMVRDCMEQYAIPLHSYIAKDLDSFLHYDIDVKVARRAAKKYAAELNADE